MRTILFVTLTACAVGLTAASSSAAPANGAAIGEAAGVATLLSNAGYYVRRHGWTCYRKCYRELLVGPRVCRTFC